MGHHDEGDGEAGTVSGWTKFTVPSGASHVVVRTLFWRIAGAGEGGQTVSVTGTGGTTNDLAMAVIARFTATDGFDPVNPIETTPLLISGTASPLATDGFHTKFINRLAVCVGTIGSSDASIGNMTGETGGDWIDRATVNTTTGSDGTINIQTSDQSNGAAIVGGSIAFTPTVSSVWLSDTFCLVPKTISVNTIEIGAIEWDQWYISPTVTTELQADGVVSTTISVTVGADAKVFMVGTILTDQEPEIPVVSDTTPTTVGTQFYSDKFGRVKYIRWYNGRSLGVRTHKVGLYTQDGSILAETEITAEIGPGWQITELPLEVEIDPEYKYVAAVHWPEGNYPKTDAALTLQIDNDVMHAYAQGGRTAAGADLTFPEVLE